MKPFLDPFPFRAPETRSSIGEVIAEITKADLKAAEAQDLKELPGKAGEAAHNKLHKTIGKFIKSEGVDHELDEGLLAKAGAVIGKKWKSVKDDYADWGTLRRKMKEAKKELAVLKKEIATADAARDVWAWGKIKELNAQLERLKNEEKERMKAEKGAAVSEGVGAYTVIKKKKTVQKGSAADSTPDTTTTEYDVTRQGVKVGTAKRDNYFGQTSGTVHGKRFSGTGSAQTDLHRFLKSKRGATVREEVVVESHTRAQLEKMTTTRLRELKTKYEGLVLKGDRKASEELATIRGLLRSKGAGSVLDEGAEG